MSTIDNALTNGKTITGKVTVPGSNQPMLRLREDAYAAVVTVTPPLAEVWLRMNYKNRTITASRVDLYARDMEDHLFKFNGETMIFDGNGLRNGQHRLLACIKTGLPFDTAVMFLPYAVGIMGTLDKSQGRSAADDLGIEGVANSNGTAAVVKTIIHAINQWPLSKAGSAMKIAAFVSAYPAVEESVKMAKSKTTLSKWPRALYGSVHFMVSSFDPEAADTFMTKLIHGLDLQEGEAPAALRKVLELNSKRPNGLSRQYHWAYLIKAMNAWMSDRRVSNLRWDPDIETTPTIDGFDYQAWQTKLRSL